MRRLWPLALLGACAVASGVHVGPVTATATVGQRAFSCSQAGVFEGDAARLRFVADPGWRPFALAGRGEQGEQCALLLVGGGAPGETGELALLDLAGRVLARQQLAEDLVYAVALSPVAPLAAAACADGRVHLLDVPDLGADRVLWRHGGPAVAVAFSLDGTLLASAGNDGKVLLGALDGQAAPRALLDHTAPVMCLAWSSAGLLASGARDGKVRLHDRSGRLLHTWQRLGGAIARVAFLGGEVEYEVAARPDSAPHTGRLTPR